MLILLMSRIGVVRRSVKGHGAELAFGETFGGDVKGAIEAGTSVLPGDNGGEFHELTLAEVLVKGRVQLVRHIGGSLRHGDCEGEYGLFLNVEMGAGFEMGDVL